MPFETDSLVYSLLLLGARAAASANASCAFAASAPPFWRRPTKPAHSSAPNVASAASTAPMAPARSSWLGAAPGGAAQGSLLVAWALGELRRAGTAPTQEDLAGVTGAVEAALATFGAEEWAGFVGRLQKGGAEAAKAQLALALAAARAPSIEQ